MDRRKKERKRKMSLLEEGNFATHLTPRAGKIMDMVLEGVKSGEIARALGLTPSYVSAIIHAPQFEHQLAVRKAHITEQFDDDLASTAEAANDLLRKHAFEAATKLVNLISSDSASVAHKASQDVLDRAGITKQAQNINIDQTNIIIDEAAALLIKETLEMDSRKRKQIESKEI